MAKFVVGELYMYAYNAVRATALYVDGTTYIECDVRGIPVDPNAAQSIRNQTEGAMLQAANDYLNYYGYPSVGQSDIEYLC